LKTQLENWAFDIIYADHKLQEGINDINKTFTELKTTADQMRGKRDLYFPTSCGEGSLCENFNQDQMISWVMFQIEFATLHMTLYAECAVLEQTGNLTGNWTASLLYDIVHYGAKYLTDIEPGWQRFLTHRLEQMPLCDREITPKKPPSRKRSHTRVKCQTDKFANSPVGCRCNEKYYGSKIQSPSLQCNVCVAREKQQVELQLLQLKKQICHLKKLYEAAGGAKSHESCPATVIQRSPMQIFGKYPDSQSALEACQDMGRPRLCAKAEIKGTHACAAGWLSDWKGYWTAVSHPSCGGSVGYHGWGSGAVGAFCCKQDLGLKDRDLVHIQNMYGSQPYLDTREGGCEGNVLCVSAAASEDRANLGTGGTGTWRIERKAGPGNVIHGDEVYIQNMYNYHGSRTYLDTRNRGCEGNELCVSAAASKHRDGKSGTWRIGRKAGPGNVIDGDEVYIQNMYGYHYLDTRNPGCDGNVLCVSAAASNDRDSGSGTWRIVIMP